MKVYQVCYLLFLFAINFLQVTTIMAQISEPPDCELNAIPAEVLSLKPVPQVRWNRGSVWRSKGHRNSGYVSYDSRQQVLLYYHRGKVESLTPLQIQGFSYYDQQLGYYRKYQSIPTKYSMQIFELLSEGTYQLMRQEKNGNAAYFNPASDKNDKFMFEYFVWDGRMVWSYQQFRYNMHDISKKSLEKVIMPRITSNLTNAQRRQIISVLHKLTEKDQLGLPKLAMKK